MFLLDFMLRRLFVSCCFGDAFLVRLDAYIYDYLVSRNLLTTAKIFKEEGKVGTEALSE